MVFFGALGRRFVIRLAELAGRLGRPCLGKLLEQLLHFLVTRIGHGTRSLRDVAEIYAGRGRNAGTCRMWGKQAARTGEFPDS